MKSVILISAICLQIGWSNGQPSEGVGAFAYQDSTGTRYGGTYGLRDGQVVDAKGDFPPGFNPPSFDGVDNFIPDYFRNFDNILQDVTRTYSPGKPFFRRFSFRPKRFPFNNFPGFGGFPGMPGYGQPGFPGQGFPGQGFPRPPFGNENSAFASAGAGPGFVQQIAAINPSNPAMPNINHFSESVPSPSGKSYSVSSSSYASSSNINGKEESHRGAETVVNDNGKVTKYKVES